MNIIEPKTILEKLNELIDYLGVRPLINSGIIWEYQLDSYWTLTYNGSGRAFNDIPPTHWLIQYKGFPAGTIDPNGEIGTTASHKANINKLQQAIQEKISQPKKTA